MEIVSPADGDSLAGTVLIVANGTDEEDAPGDLDVEYRVDSGAAITVRATDRSGEDATASVVVRADN